jgi:glycerophosphoryl diester phosphodiesterase
VEFAFVNQIYAHRGFWAESETFPRLQKNSVEAFDRAQDFRFCIETDIRDYQGRVVISHDPVLAEKNLIDLKVLKNFEQDVALNIKADGLLSLFNFSNFPDNYFFFDGSIPEMQQYKSRNLKIATRVSDIEQISATSNLLWVDYFVNNLWFETFSALMISEKNYIFVSPELHNDPYLNFWNYMKPILVKNPNVKICTDFPLDLVRLLND